MTCIEKGLSYELVPVARGSAEHYVMHPFARMPILEHDGKLVTEGSRSRATWTRLSTGPLSSPPTSTGVLGCANG
jgi:hypothetical protein